MPYGGRDEAYKNASTLAHLTAEQTLADYAVLITDLKRNLSAEASPVILFGGSYGGMLAAWMRLKYPHIAIAALASSAPILQFEDIVPLGTFYDIVSNDFRRESTNCFDTIKKSWDIMTSVGQKANGLDHLAKTFHLCGKLKSSDDLSNWLDSAYSFLAMVDYPYPSDFLMPLPAYPIKELCNRIDESPDGTTILDRIFKGVSVYYNYTGTVDCFDLDDDPHGMSGWDYQACTEMVMPMSSNRNSSMFPEWDYNSTSYAEDCWDEFRVIPRPAWITTQFGGRNISDSIVALVTEKGAHHLDLRAATADDPDWLLEQRATEVKLIKGWIADYYKKKKAVFDMPLSYRTHARRAKHGRTGKRNIIRKFEWARVRAALREYCDKHYNQLLPILAEKIYQEKVQQEKLKAVKARLNFVRFKVESMDVKGASEIMRLSGFMHGITNPELIKRSHDKIPKSVDEMIRITTSFLRREVAAGNQERKKSLSP
nr:lysosomal Pro-X carboxypeptidase [Tanacetum cinerariifolium]